MENVPFGFMRRMSIALVDDPVTDGRDKGSDISEFTQKRGRGRETKCRLTT
jgi:hypothetical protein